MKSILYVVKPLRKLEHIIIRNQKHKFKVLKFKNFEEF